MHVLLQREALTELLHLDCGVLDLSRLRDAGVRFITTVSISVDLSRLMSEELVFLILRINFNMFSLCIT